jgi:hypothetical protein
MARSSVRFDKGNYEWIAERESVGFVGTTNIGEVEFLITSDALACPEPDVRSERGSRLALDLPGRRPTVSLPTSEPRG